MKGIVKWFNRIKGYGFILGEDKEEYFVHISATNMRILKQDEAVEFEGVETDRGKQATNVKVL